VQEAKAIFANEGNRYYPMYTTPTKHAQSGVLVSRQSLVCLQAMKIRKQWKEDREETCKRTKKYATTHLSKAGSQLDNSTE
jgi:hypothetical protein